MSAYQVGTDSIDLIVSALVAGDWRGNGYGQTVSVWVPDGTVVYTEAARELIEGSRFSVPAPRAAAGDVIGRELVAANVASVAARYPGDTRADMVGGMVGYLPAGYRFRRVSRDKYANYPHALAALACFEYQSCETGERTLADLLTAEARRIVCNRISEDADAPWSWDRDWHAGKMREERERLAVAVGVVR
jgi:hypothetical protein